MNIILKYVTSIQLILINQIKHLVKEILMNLLLNFRIKLMIDFIKIFLFGIKIYFLCFLAVPLGTALRIRARKAP